MTFRGISSEKSAFSTPTNSWTPSCRLKTNPSPSTCFPPSSSSLSWVHRNSENPNNFHRNSGFSLSPNSCPSLRPPPRSNPPPLGPENLRKLQLLQAVIMQLKFPVFSVVLLSSFPPSALSLGIGSGTNSSILACWLDHRWQSTVREHLLDSKET